MKDKIQLWKIRETFIHNPNSHLSTFDLFPDLSCCSDRQTHLCVRHSIRLFPCDAVPSTTAAPRLTAALASIKVRRWCPIFSFFGSLVTWFLGSLAYHHQRQKTASSSQTLLKRSQRGSIDHPTWTANKYLLPSLFSIVSRSL
jgi:hypothetical protein